MTIHKIIKDSYLFNNSNNIKYIAIYIANNIHKLSGLYKKEVVVGDTEYYELDYFLEKLHNGSLFAFKILFLDEKYVIKTTKLFNYILQNKYKFINKKLINNYVKLIKDYKYYDYLYNNYKKYYTKIKLTPLDFSHVIDSESEEIINFKDWIKNIGQIILSVPENQVINKLSLIKTENKNTYLLTIQDKYYNKPLLNKNKDILLSNKIKTNPAPLAALIFFEDKYKKYILDRKKYKLFLKNQQQEKYIVDKNFNFYDKNVIKEIYVLLLNFIRIIVNKNEQILFTIKINNKNTIDSINNGTYNMEKLYISIKLFNKRLKNNNIFNNLNNLSNKEISLIKYKIYKDYAKINDKTKTQLELFETQ